MATIDKVHRMQRHWRWCGLFLKRCSYVQVTLWQTRCGSYCERIDEELPVVINWRVL